MKYINDLIKGDTFKGFEVSLKRNGTAIDITGASILFQFKSISTNVLSDFEGTTPSFTITNAQINYLL